MEPNWPKRAMQFTDLKAQYAALKTSVDARIQRIYGGTSEIMKEIIARDILGR